MLSRVDVVAMILVVVVFATCGAVRADPALYRDMIEREPRHDETRYTLQPYWKPTRYRLALVPFIPENFTFAGRVEITFTALVDVENICLHQDSLNVDKASLVVEEVQGGGVWRASKGKKKINVVKTGEDKLRHFYFIYVDKKLKTNHSYVVSMNYTGTLLGEAMIGFYRSSYHAADGQKRWLAASKFEPTFARKAFPCFDEPALKATFTIRISRLGNMTSISNMPQDGQPVKHMDTPDGVGRFWDTFQESPLMSTYLVAFLVSDFAHLSDASANLRIFSQPPMIEQARYALKASPLMLASLEDFTAIKYALPKMDEVALPDFVAGAMENWGLVTYREDLLLVKEGVTTTMRKQRVSAVITHELAHQWFGNLVTLHWWSSLWLNEGFANYFELFATAQVEKTWRLEEQFVVAELQSALSRDDTTDTRAMTTPVESPAAIKNVFDTISYAKAASVIRMMEHVISSETFKKGLRNYLKDRSYSTATPTILFSHLSKQFQEDNPQRAESFQLPEVMKTWTELKGYPVIRVNRDYKLSSATVTQARFLKKIYKYTKHYPKWFVPLTFTAQGEADFSSTTTKLWLKPKDNELVIPGLPATPDQWLIFNIQVTGYYRVNYDDNNWDMLSAFLNSDKFETIPAVNRAQLIDDSFSMARAGLRSYCLPLALIRYLKRETDYIPWVSALRWFQFLYSWLQDYPGSAPLKKMFVDLITPVYVHVGFEEKEADGHVTKLLRDVIVQMACRLGHPDCTTKAAKTFDQYRNEGTLIQPDVQQAVYCTALAHGDEADWNFLWEQFPGAKTSSHKTLLISVLGCSKTASVLERYLEMAISNDSSIRSQDATSVYDAVLGGENEDVALDFLIKNHRRMDPKVWDVSSTLSTLANHLKTHGQLVKLQGMLDAVSSDKAKTGSVQAAIKKVKANIRWLESSGRLVVAWARHEGRHMGKRDCRVTEDPMSELDVSTRSPAVAKSAGCGLRRPELLLLVALWGSHRV